MRKFMWITNLMALIVQDVSLNIWQNLKNIETKEHRPDEQKNNSHSPNTILPNSMFLIKLEDMHVVNFKTSEDRNT